MKDRSPQSKAQSALRKISEYMQISPQIEEQECQLLHTHFLEFCGWLKNEKKMINKSNILIPDMKDRYRLNQIIKLPSLKRQPRETSQSTTSINQISDIRRHNNMRESLSSFHIDICSPYNVHFPIQEKVTIPPKNFWIRLPLKSTNSLNAEKFYNKKPPAKPPQRKLKTNDSQNSVILGVTQGDFLKKLVNKYTNEKRTPLLSLNRDNLI